MERLLKFRLKDYNFSLIKVECYDRFEGDNYMCRVEVFKGGNSIKNRIMKYESELNGTFVVEFENKLELQLAMN
ncbi:hypothetical protein [Zobellia barbeyronii]|uniref:Uncharacterized protein n=1 Tax=Zobellia barbeyronii TaxID=2748009 RepID=A0ABS5WD30_9FLAO|nr:hypothetical protein [Zobellia barbeyronii]MBT2161303.1 hypothetical protein [Zobellia barbeyronii]